MLFRYILFIILLWMGISTSMYSQNTKCNSTSVDTSQYTGTAFFNYGSTSRAKSQKYRIVAAIGQTLIGFHESAGYSSSYGFYARYLLPPFGLKVKATQGELLDRIQLSWEIDALGPSSNEGFNIYRDGVFLATVGAKIRNYNDFNVIAGVAYTYTVRGLNAYGEGSPANALGFQVPNGVVTGWIRTVNGSPVPDAVVSLMPMQGFSAKFGAMDEAFAMKDSLHPFLPGAGKAWTLTFWMKTDSARANAGLIRLSPSNFYIRAQNSAAGHEGIEIAVSQSGSSFLSGTFPDSTKNGWHHIGFTLEGVIGRLYIDGVLMAQTVFPSISAVDSLILGNTGITPGWAGRMDELRIYHKQLTELDLKEVMEGTASSQTPFLSHYWKMDEELGERSYDIKQRQKLYFCGVTYDKDMPPVRTAGKTNDQGYYRIESASYGTGTTFLAEPEKAFYLHKSLKFNRNEMDHATLPDFAMTKKATIEMWVNNTGTSQTQSLLSKKWGSNDFRLFLQSFSFGTVIEIRMSINGNMRSFGNLGNGFQHLAFTIDSLTGVVQGYRNGISIGSHVFAGVTGNWSDTTNVWVVGARDNGGTKTDFFTGLIDEVAFYDTTLTAATILSHVNQSRKTPEKGLRVYFPFDEGSGNRLGNVGSVLLDYGTSMGAEWSSFAPNQVKQPHIFSPGTRQVTLNPSITSVDQVDFVDRSTVAVTGYVRYKNTDCFAPNVEILVNGTSYNPKIFTDSLGKFVIDFDPGATARLTPKFEDHVFVPAFWDVTNVNSPIAGIIFNDVTTRKIKGQVAGGFCKRSVIKAPAGQGQGTVCVVKIRTVDGCLERLITIDNEEGNFEFSNLPPVEKMTVAVVEHSNPLVKSAFQTQGGSTLDLSKKDTVINFIYFAEPEIEIESGLETFSPKCDVIVLDQYETKELRIRLKEVYEDGVCYIDTASFRIINGFGDETKDTTMSKGVLKYKFRVGTPNPTRPYLKTLQIISTTLEGNNGELTKQGIVTGIRAKDNFFTTILPEIPSLILRDPPGDGSSSFLEKGQSICKNFEFRKENAGGVSVNQELHLGGDVSVAIGFGVATILNSGPILDQNFGYTFTSSKVSQNTMQTCILFNQRISTSDSDLLVGPQADLFIGEASNIIFGFADIISLDTSICAASSNTVINIQPGDFRSSYIYSRYQIESYIIPNLESLYMAEKDSMRKADFLKSVKQWKANLLLNDSLISKAKVDQNVSFDALARREYSITYDTLNSALSSIIRDDAFLGGITGGYQFNKFGFSINVSGFGNINTESTAINDSIKGTTTGYILADDDPGDAFSVDIGMDKAYGTPIFRIKAGQSSCPWEPGTAKREGVLLTSVDGPVRTDVPANEPAVFKFILGNTSATNETWTYAFTAGPESNPDGAKIFCNGAPMNQNQFYAIPWGTSIPVTVTVERGPKEYSYDSLEIVLFSACEDKRANDLGILPDTAANLYSAVYVSAHFIKPCSEVNINVPEKDWVLFPDPRTEGSDDVRRITVSGYDTTATDFKLIRVQYRPSDGDGAWIPIPGISEIYNGNWSGFSGILNSKPPTLEKGSTQFFWDTQGLSDGPYEIRAVTVCTGDAENKPGSSETIKGRIDRQPPSLVGKPQPSDGVLHVGDEISFTFNQDIRCNLSINNVKLVDAATNQLIDNRISCVGNKIVIDPLFQNKFFENKILRAELYNISDLTGNVLDNTKWEFYVDRNELAWLTDSIEMTKYEDESKTIIAKIHNRGGYPVPYSIQSVPSWVHVFPDRGTLVANEIQEIQFRMDSLVPIGLLSDSIILRTETGLNPFFMGGEEVLNLKARVVCKPPPWILGSGSFNASAFSFSMNYTVQLNIEGTMSTDREDIVGAYVKDELRGIAKVQYNSVLNKYVAFLTVYSNVATGETVEFQIWDASKCFLYANTMESFTFVADGIIGMPLVPQVLRTDGKLLRRIYIHPGWNWISMNLGLSNPTVTGALKSLKNPGEGLIKNQTAFSQYSVPGKQWFGTLDTISPYYMYQLKTIAEDSILMVGVPINVSQPIPVKAGWNYIGYLPQYSLPIGAALASLTPTQGDIIKSQLGFAQYVSGSGWIGNLNFLSAPNGYLLKLTNPGVLIYPNVVNLHDRSGLRSDPMLVHEDPSRTDIDKISGSEILSNHWHIDPSRYEYSMNAVAIVVNGGGEKNMLNEGDEVGTFVGSEFRGGGKAIYVPSIDAYVLFITTYANKEGETLTFKFFDASENKEFFLMEKTAFKINSLWGGVDTPQPLHLALSTSSEDWNIDGNHVTVYPNPFTNNFAIHIQSGNTDEVKIEFKDVHGQELDSKKLNLKPGENVVEWNVKNHLPGGVYFISVRVSDKTYTLKVLHIK
jgi:hypothetical protein